jgi:hypothetical protein
MRLNILFLLIVSSQVGFSQVSIDSISYRNDLIIYRQALEQSHPSLYRFTPKERYDSLFDSIESNLSNESTELDFFRSVSRISSLIREGHTYIQPPESLISSIKNKRLFPLGVIVEDDRIMVRNSRLPELGYLKKATIDSINGQSIESIITLLEESTSTVSTFNNSRLTKNLSLYNNFALAYYYFIDTTSNFRIDYRPHPKAKSISIEVEGSSDQLSRLSYPELPPEPLPPFYLEVDEQRSTATMRISTFAYWIVDKKMKDYSKFFKESFISLQEQNIKHLIIDVRGNRGGEEMIAGELLTYLIDTEFDIYRYCKAKTLDFSFTNSLPQSNRIKLAKNNYTASDSGFVMKKANFLKPYTPKKEHNFDGKVYVLSDGICASANNIFLALVKTYNVGTIVGQESGGAFEDVDGRLRIRFTLPYSRIFVSYPAWRMKLNTKNGNKLRGVIPDYEISPTIEDVITGKDTETEFVLQLIGKLNKSPIIV